MTPQSTPCMEWVMVKNSQGYGLKKHDGKLWLSHRLAWGTVNGPIPDGMCVLHKCDNPACVNVDHLFLGTKADNVADMYAKGRSVHGEKHKLAKLTTSQVLEIRARYAAGGVTQAAMAKEFGVTHTLIHMIVHRKTWRHINDL